MIYLPSADPHLHHHPRIQHSYIYTKKHPLFFLDIFNFFRFLCVLDFSFFLCGVFFLFPLKGDDGIWGWGEGGIKER